MFRANLKDSPVQEVTTMQDLKVGDIAEVIERPYLGVIVTLVIIDDKKLILNLSDPVVTDEALSNGWRRRAPLKVRVLQPGEEIILKVTND